VGGGALQAPQHGAGGLEAVRVVRGAAALGRRVVARARRRSSHVVEPERAVDGLHQCGLARLVGHLLAGIDEACQRVQAAGPLTLHNLSGTLWGYKTGTAEVELMRKWGTSVISSKAPCLAVGLRGGCDGRLVVPVGAAQPREVRRALAPHAQVERQVAVLPHHLLAAPYTKSTFQINFSTFCGMSWAVSVTKTVTKTVQVKPESGD